MKVCQLPWQRRQSEACTDRQVIFEALSEFQSETFLHSIQKLIFPHDHQKLQRDRN
jgi:hypothetical protein